MPIKTKDQLLNEALQDDITEDDIFENDLEEGKGKKEGDNPFDKKDDSEDDSEDDEEDEDEPIESSKKNKKEGKNPFDKKDDSEDDEDDMKETDMDGVDNGDVEGRKGTSKTGDPKTKASKASAKMKETQDSKGKNSFKAKSENLEINVEENVKELVKGAKFSPEYEKKIATIFESAVREQVKRNIVELEKEYEKQSKAEIAEAVEAIEAKVEQYIDYVSKEYIKENKLAIEQGVRAELVENFIVDFKELCQQHSIEISDDQLDIVVTAKEEKEAIEAKLDEQIAENIKLQAKLNGNSMTTVVESLSKDLVATDKEKYIGLIEDVIYINEDDYKEKLSTIREHYFNVPTEIVEDYSKEKAGTDEKINDDKKKTSDSLITASVNTLRQYTAR